MLRRKYDFFGLKKVSCKYVVCYRAHVRCRSKQTKVQARGRNVIAAGAFYVSPCIDYCRILLCFQHLRPVIWETVQQLFHFTSETRSLFASVIGLRCKLTSLECDCQTDLVLQGQLDVHKSDLMVKSVQGRCALRCADCVCSGWVLIEVRCCARCFCVFVSAWVGVILFSFDWLICLFIHSFIFYLFVFISIDLLLLFPSFLIFSLQQIYRSGIEGHYNYLGSFDFVQQHTASQKITHLKTPWSLIILQCKRSWF